MCSSYIGALAVIGVGLLAVLIALVGAAVANQTAQDLIEKSADDHEPIVANSKEYYVIRRDIKK